MRLASILTSLRSNGDPNFEGTMATRDARGHRGGRLAAVAGLCLLLAHGGCGLDEVKVPPLSGPAELGLSLDLKVTPDVITADGLSTASVTATVRDQNGQPVAGREIFFALADAAGLFADIGTLYDATQSQRLAGGTATVRTGSNGVARAIYQSPPRTDATANQKIAVSARPVGTDATSALYRSVQVELRSAEPRLFPQGGGATAVCSFIVEAPGGQCSAVNVCTVHANTAVLFQSTSFASGGTIVRYQWYFGDGTGTEYAPDTAHVFKFSGFYSVTHVVTANSGSQAACAAGLTVD